MIFFHIVAGSFALASLFALASIGQGIGALSSVLLLWMVGALCSEDYAKKISDNLKKEHSDESNRLNQQIFDLKKITSSYKESSEEHDLGVDSNEIGKLKEKIHDLSFDISDSKLDVESLKLDKIDLEENIRGLEGEIEELNISIMKLDVNERLYRKMIDDLIYELGNVVEDFILHTETLVERDSAYELRQFIKDQIDSPKCISRSANELIGILEKLPQFNRLTMVTRDMLTYYLEVLVRNRNP